MKLKETFIKNLLLIFFIVAISITLYVLFIYPQPGVADQGDFNRVITVSGLELTDEYKNSSDFDKFYNFIIPEYQISDTRGLNFSSGIPITSLSFLIYLISFICKVFGQSIFKTNYLVIAYSILYVFSICTIFKYINMLSKATLLLIILASTFVFLDGNYLVWFNSLYGEPMMITTLMIYISSWIYYIYHKNVLKSEKIIFPSISFIFITAFLFLVSKLQTITALPIILLMLFKLLWENRNLLNIVQSLVLYFLFFILLIYPIKTNITSSSLSNDTHYNSVFSGILKDSKDPHQDLLDLGLNPNMTVEAGKDSYLPTDKYVKYIPGSDLTENEFYSKITNGKLMKFYITHPIRLIEGMKYTANHAFFTGTFLGKYEKSYSDQPIRTFNRFTLWSDFRAKMLPKNLIFIVFIYTTVFITSLFIYKKNNLSEEVRSKVQLFWSLMFISLLQFPMSYIGNGQCDTSKQLYLFNFIFDIILVVSICWCFNKLTTLIFFYYKKITFSKR